MSNVRTIEQYVQYDEHVQSCERKIDSTQLARQHCPLSSRSREREGDMNECLTLVYRIASSQFVLSSGIIPSRCAMNSSVR